MPVFYLRRGEGSTAYKYHMGNCCSEGSLLLHLQGKAYAVDVFNDDAGVGLQVLA